MIKEYRLLVDSEGNIKIISKEGAGILKWDKGTTMAKKVVAMIEEMEK